jgi:hypothetical protein
MIEIKCPACSAGGRLPRDKKDTRLVCRKCLAVFHLSPSGVAVLGEPPESKNAPKEKVRRAAGGSSGGRIELGGSFDEISAQLSKIKLPRVSGAAMGISAGVILVGALAIFLFARQGLTGRAETIARSVMSAETVKNAMDVAVPETALDVIRWHSEASRKYGELKMALGGVDAKLNLNVLSDGSKGPAVIVAQFSAEGTRMGNAGIEAIHPNPSLASPGSSLELHLYLVKDSFGNWLLDGTRTFNDTP